jgi:type II secretory pathway component GspD/PulD (secretin)
MRNFPRRRILAVCLACCFSIVTFAQQVTFKVKNVTVKTAVIKFKKTTGYSFVFGSNKVDTNKRISGKFNIEVQSVDRYNLNNLYLKTPRGQGASSPHKRS